MSSVKHSGVKKSSAGEEEIWLFLADREEVGFSEWQRAFVDSKLMANQTYLNHKKSLEASGKVKKKISEKTGRPVYYIPDEKKALFEKLLRKRKLNSEFDKLSPSEQSEFIRKLTKERDSYKRLNRIHELEELLALPARAVIKKLLDLDYKVEDLYSEETLKDPDFKATIENPFQDNFILPSHLINVYNFSDVEGELADAKNIEIKIVPPEDYFTSNHLDIRKIKAKYGGEWNPLVDKPIKGAGIIGAWKELSVLYKALEEEDLLKWKDQYQLSDKDWEIVGPKVRELLEEGLIPMEIKYFLDQFVLSKHKKEQV